MMDQKPCYSAEALAPFDNEDINNTSIDQMRKDLEEGGWELDAAALPNEVEEIHEEYILKKSFDNVLTNQHESVSFPLLDASTIDKILEPEQQDNGHYPNLIRKQVCDIYFSEGGQFVGGNVIRNDLLPPLLILWNWPMDQELIQDFVYFVGAPVMPWIATREILSKPMVNY